MPPQYTPTIPPILSASADVFYMPQSPKASPKYTPTTPTFYHHEDVSYSTSPIVYLPPIPQTPPAAISPPHQYGEYNDSPPTYETNDWSSYTSEELENDTNSVLFASHLSYSPDSSTNTPSATTHSRPKRKKTKEELSLVVNQNVNGIIRAWKLEGLIQTMTDNNIDAYTIQETWLTGDWETKIHGYLVIHHNHEKCEKKKKGRE